VEWVTLARNKEQWRAVVNAVMNVKFLVITRMTIQIIVLDVVPLFLVDIQRSLEYSTLQMEATGFSETGVMCLSVTTRFHIAEIK
jgi:hypothetical protein